MIHRPITLRQANQFVKDVHRHHEPVGPRAKFAIGALDDSGELVGVVICGRPVARGLDDGATLEILRLATDGHFNACSFLLSKVRKAAPHLGYRRVLTYILKTEPGASLAAAGYVPTGEVKGREWDTQSRPRRRKGGAQTQDKVRYEVATCSSKS